MIISFEKNLKFLPKSGPNVVGRWLALTSPKSGVSEVLILLGPEITLSETQLSLSQLFHIGYDPKYKIYPPRGRFCPPSASSQNHTTRPRTFEHHLRVYNQKILAATFDYHLI